MLAQSITNQKSQMYFVVLLHATVIALRTAPSPPREFHSRPRASFLTQLKQSHDRLSVCLTQIQSAPDGHFRFHAACVANLCFEQLISLWQKQPSLESTTSHLASVSEANAEEAAGAARQENGGLGAVAGVAAGSVAAALVASETDSAVAHPWVAPWLGHEAVQAMLAMLWANLDEPLAQTLRQVGNDPGFACRKGGQGGQRGVTHIALLFTLD